MMKERTQQISSATLATQRITHDLSQCANVVRNEVGQVNVFAVIPNLLDRIKIRGISRQPFDVQAAESQLEFPYRRTMNHPPVDNQDDSLGKMSQYLPDKLLKVVGVYIRVLYRKIQRKMMSPRRNTYRRNSRQPVATIPAIMDWCLAFRGPCAANRWLKQKTTLIRKYNGFTASTGFFLFWASPSFAKWQLRFHRVLLLDARAFGNSSPCLSEYARHWTIRSGSQSAFQLPRLFCAGSITRWYNRYTWCPLTEVSQAGAFAYPTNCWGGQEGCGLERTVRLTCRRMPANPTRWMGLPQPIVQSRGYPVLVSAMRWLYAAVAPTVWLFLRVSYP